MIVARHKVPGVVRKIAPSQRDGASLHRYPGTSCLATISLSLRDKSHSPIEGLRTKLALMGLEPWAMLSWPFGPQTILNIYEP
jgi:hypothetical protein